MAAPNWANRTMWTGDNLEVMRGMNSESVDLIYADPPFNSNRIYEAPIGSKAAGAMFKDTWTLSDVDVAWHGYLADKEPGLYAAIDAARHTHGKSMMSYLIMMGIRLIEMRRILKHTGSIYLHCDPTASHYLKMVMDAVFGKSSFRNEIIWHRPIENLSRKKFRRAAESLLYYSKSDNPVWNKQYGPIGERQRKDYRYSDDGGPYATTPCTNNADRPNMLYEFNGNVRQWRYSKETMLRYERQGLLVFNKDGLPRRKKYLSDAQGAALTDVWSDINLLRGSDKERTEYPTQKPLALLERIIKSSSNEGDCVFDPFAGCATACVSAEMLNRQWVGIDISPKAVDLVRIRIEQLIDLFGDKIIRRTESPRRTDVKTIPRYGTHKHDLYGQQEGYCNGCKEHFPFRNMTIDHKIPQSQRGGDDIGNLQLLCGACNSLKGDRDMPYLLTELKKLKLAVPTQRVV